jgi:glutamate--glyoxylate aminotransferase
MGQPANLHSKPARLYVLKPLNLSACFSFYQGGLGAYSDSRGNAGVLAEISDFLQERDGFGAPPSNLFLTNGASEGVRMCLRALLTNSGGKRGVLTPVRNSH